MAHSVYRSLMPPCAALLLGVACTPDTVLGPTPVERLRELGLLDDEGAQPSFAETAEGLRVDFPAEAYYGLPRRTLVILPPRADGNWSLTDDESKAALKITLAGAQGVQGTVDSGLLVYRAGEAQGADIVQRPTVRGTEDYLIFTRRPAAEELRYEVALSPEVAGLRLVSSQLEFLAANGSPRLRISPPYLVDASSTRHAISLEIVGCAVDTNPAAPWDRPVVDPGARSCQIVVRWAELAAAYPVVIDPSWSATTSMGTARLLHTATLVTVSSSERLLVAGGRDHNNWITSAELYRASDATWTATGSLNVGRDGHAAALLGNGKVLVSGGDVSGNANLATCELYDPSAGTWSTTGSLNAGRAFHGQVVLNSGDVLVVGGASQNQNAADALSSVELYSVSGGTWTTRTAMGTARTNIAAYDITVSGNERVLVFGGLNGTATQTSAELYNPSADSWASTGSLATARERYASVKLPSGKIFVVGGYNGSAAQASTEIYDPATVSWSAGASMSAGRYEHAIAIYKQNALVLATGGSRTEDTAETYNISTDAWSSAGTMGSGHSTHTASTLADGAVIVAGGVDNGNNPIVDVDIYQTSLDLLAGTLGGAGNVNGNGTEARLWTPNAITFDGSSTFYIADSDNHTLRKIVSGTVTTLAGGAGFYGNTNANGTAARFNYPMGVAYYSGAVYIADSGNHTIRKFDTSTFDVTTVAGSGSEGSADGTGSAASFSFPQSIASDGAGNLYVGDYQNTLRKIVISTGAVTTVAGQVGINGADDGTGTAATFYVIGGLHSDGTNLYMTDSVLHTLRRMVLSTGVVTTLAGSAGAAGSTDATGTAARFRNPTGLVGDGTYLYITDSGNHTIRRYTLSDGAVSTRSGTAGSAGYSNASGTAGKFNQPMGCVLSGQFLYVADAKNHAVRTYRTNNNANTTLAGLGVTRGSADGTGTAASFYVPGAMDVDSTYAYLPDVYNHTIRRVNFSTGATTTIAGTAGAYGTTDGTGAAARFGYPFGVAYDGAANLYITDFGNQTIRKLELASNAVTTLAGTAGTMGGGDGTGTAATFRAPKAITYSGGYLYIADARNHTIRQIVVATGAVTTLAGTAESSGTADGTGSAARFNFPGGVAADGAGNLFVSDTDNHTIRKIVISTGVVTTFAGTAGTAGAANGTGTAATFNQPQQIYYNGGYLYVADFANHAIRKIDTTSAVVTTALGTLGTGKTVTGVGVSSATLSAPVGVAINSAGDTIVSLPYENSVVSVK